MNKKIKLIINFAIFVLIILTINLILWKPVSNVLSSIENIKNFILSFGIFAPLVFIDIVILQVFIAPIPGQLIGIASGYIFGVWYGTLICLIGLVIGSFLVFSLTRLYGRPLAEKLVSKKSLTKFDKFLEGKGTFAMFLIFLLPAMPDDILCYAAGFTKIKTKTFLLIAALGRLPGYIVLNLIGAGFSNFDTKTTILFLSILAAFSFAIYLYKNWFEEKISKIIDKIGIKNKKTKPSK